MPKTFGEILKEARNQQGLKAMDVCMGTGISQQVYSKIETGKTKRISFEDLGRLCSFLHIDANQLFGLNSVDEIIPRVAVGIDYKQKIISQLKDCIEAIKETKSQLLIKLAEEIVINEVENAIEIAYQERKYLFNKYDSLGVVAVCCITSLFLNEVLKVTEKEISENEFDLKLVRLYVQCENILNDILSK